MIIGDEVMVTNPTGGRPGFVGRVWYADPAECMIHVRNFLTGEIGKYPRKWCLVRIMRRARVVGVAGARWALSEY
jgi:hypothetical protein